MNQQNQIIKLPLIKKDIKKNAGALHADWTSKQLDIYQPKEESEKLRGIGLWDKQGEEQEILRHISRTYNKFRT